MRESRLYLQFLHKYILYISVLGLILGLIGGVVNGGPTKYSYTRSYEVRFESGQVSESVTLADQAVAKLREMVGQGRFGANGRILIYKSGPLLIKISAESEDMAFSSGAVERIGETLEKELEVLRLGNDKQAVIDFNRLWGLIIGGFIGICIGVGLSLFKEYFTRY